MGNPHEFKSCKGMTAPRKFEVAMEPRNADDDEIVDANNQCSVPMMDGESLTKYVTVKPTRGFKRRVFYHSVTTASTAEDSMRFMKEKDKCLCSEMFPIIEIEKGTTVTTCVPDSLAGNEDYFLDGTCYRDVQVCDSTRASKETNKTVFVPCDALKK